MFNTCETGLKTVQVDLKYKKWLSFENHGLSRLMLVFEQLTLFLKYDLLK